MANPGIFQLPSAVPQLTASNLRPMEPPRRPPALLHPWKMPYDPNMMGMGPITAVSPVSSAPATLPTPTVTPATTSVTPAASTPASSVTSTLSSISSGLSGVTDWLTANWIWVAGAAVLWLVIENGGHHRRHRR